MYKRQGLQYAVSVALVYEQPDHILLGVVYNPKDDIWYYACKGKGSYILEKGMVTQLRVRTFPPDEGIVVFGMPYDRRKTGKILDVYKRQDEKLLKYGELFETKLMDLSVNIPLEDALDLGWEILAECFEPNETGLKTSLLPVSYTHLIPYLACCDKSECRDSSVRG